MAAGRGIPSGGLAGQALVKTSDTPFEVAWSSVAGGASGVDFVQASADTTWTIAHNLGHYPVVELLTVGGARMLADIVHLSVNTLQVSFAAPTAGRARLV